jgi:hypothetical protein
MIKIQSIIEEHLNKLGFDNLDNETYRLPFSELRCINKTNKEISKIQEETSVNLNQSFWSNNKSKCFWSVSIINNDNIIINQFFPIFLKLFEHYSKRYYEKMFELLTEYQINISISEDFRLLCIKHISILPKNKEDINQTITNIIITNIDSMNLVKNKFKFEGLLVSLDDCCPLRTEMGDYVE